MLNGAGGAINTDGDGVSIVNCTIRQNWAGLIEPCGINIRSGTLMIDNSYISFNNRGTNPQRENDIGGSGLSSVSHSFVGFHVSDPHAPHGNGSGIDIDRGGNIPENVEAYISADDWRLIDINSPLYHSGSVVYGTAKDPYHNDYSWDITALGDYWGQVRDNTENPDIGACWLITSKYTSVDFIENPNQQFGFDRVDYDATVPSSADIYVSLPKNSDPVNHPENSTTVVNVVAQDLRQPLYIRSSDESVFKIDNVSFNKNVTPVRLYGQNISGKSTRATLDILRQDGTIIRSLNVMVYERLSIPNVNCYFIEDTQSPSASKTIPASRPALNDIKDMVNDIYKQSVTDITSVGGNTEIDLHYDINGNGIFDLYWGGANPELDVINNNPVFTGDSKIATVGKMRASTRTTEEIQANTTPSSITLESTAGIVPLVWYILGPENTDETWTNPDNNAEMVMFVSMEGNKAFFTNDKMVCNHPAGQVLYPIKSSLAGLSTNPQLVSSQADIGRVVAHEMMHRYEYPTLGGLSDVKENDNLMVYMYGINSGLKLRFRDQTCVNTGTGSENGEKEGQWDKIHRIGYGLLTLGYRGDLNSGSFKSPQPGLHKLGTTFTGEAVAAEGYLFDGWSAIPSTGITISTPASAVSQMVLNSNAELVADFVKK